MSTLAFVSASDLGVPVRARKEFHRAIELAERRDLAGTIERLNRAIEIYPQYASAYNNLGVTYSQLGDQMHAREALQKAIEINDHLAPAYVNLARMSIVAREFSDAEAVLSKVSAFAPDDSAAQVLLSYSEFMDHRLNDAIHTATKAHALRGIHAIVHQVAARAYEQQGRGPEAVAELEMFLKEESSGHRAENARKELAELRAILRRGEEAEADPSQAMGPER